MVRVTFKILFLTLSILGGTTAAMATKPTVPLDPQLRRAEVIVVGTALHSRQSLEAVCRFQTGEILKGHPPGREITVRFGNGLVFEKGETYILFLTGDSKSGWRWIE